VFRTLLRYLQSFDIRNCDLSGNKHATHDARQKTRDARIASLIVTGACKCHVTSKRITSKPKNISSPCIDSRGLLPDNGERAVSVVNYQLAGIHREAGMTTQPSTGLPGRGNLACAILLSVMAVTPGSASAQAGEAERTVKERARLQHVRLKSL
jgi:hypothetical protein